MAHRDWLSSLAFETKFSTFSLSPGSSESTLTMLLSMLLIWNTHSNNELIKPLFILFIYNSGHVGLFLLKPALSVHPSFAKLCDHVIDCHCNVLQGRPGEGQGSQVRVMALLLYKVFSNFGQATTADRAYDIMSTGKLGGHTQEKIGCNGVANLS